MRSAALSIHTVAIAVAAISFSSSAGAGLVLCGDVTDHALVQKHCGHNDSRKNNLSIDYIFDAATPAPTWVLLDHKPGGSKLDHHWYRLDLPNGWIFGTAFVPDGKRAQAQLHGGAPSRNIPEPGTLALLSIGLLGAALSCRYKRK